MITDDEIRAMRATAAELGHELVMHLCDTALGELCATGLCDGECNYRAKARARLADLRDGKRVLAETITLKQIEQVAAAAERRGDYVLASTARRALLDESSRVLLAAYWNVYVRKEGPRD